MPRWRVTTSVARETVSLSFPLPTSRSTVALRTMRLPRSTSWMLPALAAAPLPVGAGLKEGDAGDHAAERAGRLLASPEAPPPLCAPLVRPPPPHPAATSAASAKPASARPRLVIGRIVIPPSRSHPFPLLPAAVARSDACTAPMVPMVWFPRGVDSRLPLGVVSGSLPDGTARQAPRSPL